MQSHAERVRRIESGEIPVVGVNCVHRDCRFAARGRARRRVGSILVVDEAAEQEQLEHLEAWRATRDRDAVARALDDRPRRRRRRTENLMPATIALRARRRHGRRVGRRAARGVRRVPRAHRCRRGARADRRRRCSAGREQVQAPHARSVIRSASSSASPGSTATRTAPSRSRSRRATRAWRSCTRASGSPPSRSRRPRATKTSTSSASRSSRARTASSCPRPCGCCARPASTRRSSSAASSPRPTSAELARRRRRARLHAEGLPPHRDHRRARRARGRASETRRRPSAAVRRRLPRASRCCAVARGRRDRRRGRRGRRRRGGARARRRRRGRRGGRGRRVARRAPHPRRAVAVGSPGRRPAASGVSSSRLQAARAEEQPDDAESPGGRDGDRGVGDRPRRRGSSASDTCRCCCNRSWPSARRKVLPVSVVFWELDGLHGRAERRAGAGAHRARRGRLAHVARERRGVPPRRRGRGRGARRHRGAGRGDGRRARARVAARRARSATRSRSRPGSRATRRTRSTPPSSCRTRGEALEAARADGHERDHVAIAPAEPRSGVGTSHSCRARRSRPRTSPRCRGA